MLSWLLFAGLGRILIFVWQRFPEKYVPTAFLKDVHDCDLCSGVYIYTGFAIALGVGWWSLLLGPVTSAVVWIFVRGVKSLHEETLYIK